MLSFPSPFTPDLSTRAGRMMAAGRVKVTVSSTTDDRHITVLLKCFADNRNREYASDVNRNWVECPLAHCTHLFAEVPRSSGEWNDKIGTFYPRSGRWFDADNSDPRRIEAAVLVGHWLQNPNNRVNPLVTFQEASECGVCGLELTDPVSIERGIGPTCYGKLTGSQHQVKHEDASMMEAIAPGADVLADEATQQALDLVYKPTPFTGTHEFDQVTPENVTQLNLTSGAVNAMYSLAKCLSESQVEELAEWAHLRLEQIRGARRRFVAEERTQDREPGGDSVQERLEQESPIDFRRTPRSSATDRSTFMGR